MYVCIYVCINKCTVYIYLRTHRPLRLARVGIFEVHGLQSRAGTARNITELEHGIPEVLMLRRGIVAPEKKILYRRCYYFMYMKKKCIGCSVL